MEMQEEMQELDRRFNNPPSPHCPKCKGIQQPVFNNGDCVGFDCYDCGEFHALDNTTG